MTQQPDLLSSASPPPLSSRRNRTNENNEVALLHESLEALYQSTPWTVFNNCEESIAMDLFLKSLKSPAHQAFFVIKHAVKFSYSSVDAATDIETTTKHSRVVQEALMYCKHLLKPNCKFIVNQTMLDDHRKKNENENEAFMVQPGIYFNTIMLENTNDGSSKKKKVHKNIGGENRNDEDDVSTTIPSGWIILNDSDYYPSSKSIVQKFVNQSRNVQRLSADNHSSSLQNQQSKLGQDLYNFLFMTLGSDLRNGAAAEVAFDLSLAAFNDNNNDIVINDEDDVVLTDLVSANDIFDILAHIAALEINRKSSRSTRKAKDVLGIVEKLAASGIKGHYINQAYESASKSLIGSKGYNGSGSDTKILLSSTTATSSTVEVNGGTKDRKGSSSSAVNLSLTSFRPLVWLWRRAHLLHKVSDTDIQSSLSLESIRVDEYSNPDLPLVIDIGCGLGVSLLGLAAGSNIKTATPTKQAQSFSGNVDYKHISCWGDKWNYLGGDLSPRAIQWANAMTKRWDLTNRLQYRHISTENILEWALKQNQYDIGMILLQFPTPFRLQMAVQEGGNKNDEDRKKDGSNQAGNERLPPSPDDASFMANPTNLKRIVDILNKSQRTKTYLLVQSNAEDVAIYIYKELCSLGLEPIESDSPQTLESLIDQGCTTRTQTWLQQQQQKQQGDPNTARAVGPHWSSVPYLPVMTETEASCDHQGTPIHRCLFRK